mgnify:CR=1 FL=1|eukprot:scaffold42117_cov33-Tisochrysis_lutea.AAC.1
MFTLSFAPKFTEQVCIVLTTALTAVACADTVKASKKMSLLKRWPYIGLMVLLLLKQYNTKAIAASPMPAQIGALAHITAPGR